MKKVLEVLPAFGTGGVESYVFDVLRSLAKKHEQHTFYVASSGGALVDKLPANVKHFTIPLKKRSPFSITRNALTLRKICKAYHIERLHVHSRAPAWSVYLTSKLLSIPFAATFHGAHKAQNWFKRFYNSSMLRGEYVIAVSQFIHQHLKEVYAGYIENKIVDIFEGIDTNRFCKQNITFDQVLAKREALNIPFYHKVILLPGRFTKLKGHLEYIEAFQKLPEDSKNNITTIFIGNVTDNQNYLEILKHKVATHKMTCLFLDSSDQLALFYALSDMVIIPTQVPESFGRVIAEALSMQAVVVSINHGGAIELSHDGRYAFLAEPNNLEDLSVKMNRALSLSIKEKKDLTENTHEFLIKNYSLHSMIQKIETQIYS
jgi:glycosyltransferase involved in cell wall biosynthesis